MGVFHYKAAAPSGKVVEGQLEAVDQTELVRHLQAQGYIPIRADAVDGHRKRKGPGDGLFARRQVTRDDVHLLLTELSTLLEAGLPLDKALELLTGLADRGPVRAMLSRVNAAVRGGEDLSSAFEAQGDTFSRLQISIIRAGEAGGGLGVALERLVDFMDRARDLRDTVLSALVYPLFLLGFAGVSVVILITFVIPRFATLFADAGQVLPWPTQLVMLTGVFFQNYGWMVAAFLAVVSIYLRHEWQNDAWRGRWDRRALQIPVLGDLVSKLEAARFTRTLGTLLANGVSLLDALAIAREVIGNRAVAAGVEPVSASVREGRGLGRPLLEADVFPVLAAHMVQVGEETGNLDGMLLRLADIYERETKSAIKRLVAIIEPVLILSLGLLVAGIILSILVAILRVNELAF